MLQKFFARLDTWVLIEGADPIARRRGQLLTYLLFIFIASSIFLAIINFGDWLFTRQSLLFKYAWLDLLMGGAMAGLLLLNKRGKSELAAHLCLGIIITSTLIFFQLKDFYVVLPLLAIPVFISSFILNPNYAFLYAVVASLGYSGIYLINKTGDSFAYVPLLSLFVVAAVSNLIAWRYDKGKERLSPFDHEIDRMFERLPVGLYRTTPTGEILGANLTLVEMMGYSDQKSIMKVNISDHFADPKPYDECLKSIQDDGKHQNHIEAQFRRQDGSVFWASDSTTAVCDDRGNIIYFEGCLIDIDHRKRTEVTAREKAEQFARLYEVSQDLASQHDLHSLLERIVDHALELAQVSGGGIYLYEAKSKVLRVEVSKGIDGIQVGTRLNLDEGMAGHVANTQKAVIIKDYQSWEFRAKQNEGGLLRGIVGVPMLFNGELIGVLVVHEANLDNHTFTDDDVHLLTLLAGQAAIAVNNAQLYNDAMKRLNQIEALRSIDKIMSANTDLRLTLNTTLAEAARQLDISALDILTVNPYKHMLEYAAGLGFRTTGIEKFSLSLNDSTYHKVVEDRRILQLHNFKETGCAILQARKFIGEEFNCYIGIPLIAKGQVVGILEAFDRDHFERDEEWQEFLETLGQQAAIAIDNANLFEDLARSNTELSIAYETTLEGWSRALDLRDQATEGHTRRVTQMTVTLASFLGIKNYDLLNIRRGALLHDIGKMGIPDEILLKPGPFLDKEWDWMHEHPRLAYEMLLPIRYLHPALDIPYCHHERWDGTGYPRGLKGKEIPLAARIFSVVDVWDAMTSDRPYRAALSRAEANSYLKEQAGSHFDPEAVNAFFKFYGEQ